jgi:hypothetical protein
MLKILKIIKTGKFCKVVNFDDDGNLRMVYLRYNAISHKFYTIASKKYAMRKTITRYQAEDLILKTLSLKKINLETNNTLIDKE